MNIRGSEYPLKKIFSDDFVFTIPRYQRAYAWTTEQSEELFQDLLRAMDSYEKSIDDLPPYFLGSIVLIKEDDEPDAQIIDLSRVKNMKAANYDFDDKKQKYFRTSDGISPFVLTTQVLNHQEWTPAVIERRQSQLMGILKQLWRL